MVDIHTAKDNPGKCAIFCDSQAAIRTIRSPRLGSGQYILSEAAQLLDTLRSHGWEVQFRWIPAHSRIWGNELADEAAKETASCHRDPLNEQVLVATAKATIRKTMKNE